MHRYVTVLLALSLASAAAACGGGGPSSPALTVFAASSLKGSFGAMQTAFVKEHPGTKITLEFAGSDALAAQIEQGARPDVYAAASPKYPKKLAGEKKIDASVPFATNTLVLAVPASGTKVGDVRSLRSPGTKVVIGSAGVPIGDYTRTVLGKLDATYEAGWSSAVLGNVVSQQPDVKSVLAQLASGEADAGFVYATDVRAAGGKVRAIAIPAAAQPTVSYPIAVVSGSKAAELARQWVAFVRSQAGRTILRTYGFGTPG